MGERVNLGLVATEVERLRLWVAERESVPESAGEARKVAGRVGVYLSSGWGLLIGLEQAVSYGLQHFGL